jgi:hypothetical protein
MKRSSSSTYVSEIERVPAIGEKKFSTNGMRKLPLAKRSSASRGVAQLILRSANRAVTKFFFRVRVYIDAGIP